jgi:dihydrofolate reductase
MALLHYMAITSLDGYVADADGRFEWAAPDDEVLASVNRLQHGIGTYLYGRRMYQTMRFWETFEGADDAGSLDQEFARMSRAADKVVYSRTLGEVDAPRTAVHRQFDPATVRRLKDDAPADLSVAGADLAGQAIAAGLVDELHLWRQPVLVGGGTAALPGGVRTDLTLLGSRRFDGGAVQLRYRLER